MLLFDATHTSHSRAQTGIQRVCRSLFAELERRGAASAICFDPYLQGWRSLDSGELARLRDRSGAGGHSRSAQWPLHRQVVGHMRRLTGRQPQLPESTGAIFPELFSAKIGANVTELGRLVKGPRIALFHDSIGLKYPELTPLGTVARLPAYLRELLQFDGVAAISEDSAACLREFWAWLGVPDAPPVQPIPLGIDPLPATEAGSAPRGIPRILCVSTIEGRKNHGSLLEAAESLWQTGLKFELELIGLARSDTAAAALAKIRELQTLGRSLIYHGTATEAALQNAYRQCSFTIYPSLSEGFGLPVLESLQHGRPCLCSGRGALGESTRGGGCLELEALDAKGLAAGMRRLLSNPEEIHALEVAARRREFRSWRDYATDLLAWQQDLSRR